MTQDQRRKTIATAMVTIFVSLVLTIAVGAAYTTDQIHRTNARADHAIQTSDQRWCDLFEDITKPRPAPPVDPTAIPQSEFGKQLLAYNKALAQANRKFLDELLALARSSRCSFVK